MVALRCNEVTVELLRVFDPSCAENLKSIGFVWVVLGQEPNIPLLFVLVPQVAAERILVLEDRILFRHGLERIFTVHFRHLLLVCDSVFRRLFEVSLVWIIVMLEFAEKPSAVLKLYVATLFNLIVQV